MQTPIPLYTIPNNEGTKTVFGVKITGAIYITDMKNPYSHVIVCVCVCALYIVMYGRDASYCLFFRHFAG